MFGNYSITSLSLVAFWLATALAGCAGPQPTPPATNSTSPYQATEMLSGSEKQQIHLGKLIFDETPKYASAYVGNKLSCSDCHIQSGTAAHAAPMINVANLFPMFNKRAGRVISLQERFQECFARSENGRPLPMDSVEMKALTAYVNSLSIKGKKGEAYKGRGFVKIDELVGNPVKGKSLYASKCAGCHGADGAGTPPILPPVWGPNSYNDGAGMDDPKKMAAFLVRNMPQNYPQSLTAQDAFDVAAFMHSMPRPKFNQAYKNY
ncbi:MAG: c-type cytochrome [Acidobacteriaceae bacterium]